MKTKRQSKKKKGFDLREQYKFSWEYLKECKNYIWIIVGVFFAFALFGYFVQPSQEIVDMIMKFIEELLAQTEGMSRGELVGFIFLNNLQSSFLGLIFGFVLGIFPILAAVANGYLVGFVAHLSVAEAGAISLWKLFPHGIFELPAVFIALGMGMKFGTFVFQKKKLDSFNRFLIESLRVFIFIVLPLLVIAGIIEGTLIFLMS